MVVCVCVCVCVGGGGGGGVMGGGGVAGFQSDLKQILQKTRKIYVYI